jgi:hypothetical protein
MFKTEAEARQDFQDCLERNGGLVDFDGKNCNELDRDCGGWDGESRRCDCGNRRVYLLVQQSKSDNLWRWYAEAY